MIASYSIVKHSITTGSARAPTHIYIYTYIHKCRFCKSPVAIKQLVLVPTEDGARVSQEAILSYAILCYPMLSYPILYYIILCYAILYYTILYYNILYYPILCYTTIDYDLLYHTIPYHTILYYSLTGWVQPNLPTKIIQTKTA